MRVFISQPMRGKTDEEIRKIRADVTDCVKEMFGCDVEVMESIFVDEHEPLCYLGRSIAMIAEAELVCFAPGWSKARGCRIENMAAHEYGKPIFEMFGKD